MNLEDESKGFSVEQGTKTDHVQDPLTEKGRSQLPEVAPDPEPSRTELVDSNREIDLAECPELEDIEDKTWNKPEQSQKRDYSSRSGTKGKEPAYLTSPPFVSFPPQNSANTNPPNHGQYPEISHSQYPLNLSQSQEDPASQTDQDQKAKRIDPGVVLNARPVPDPFEIDIPPTDDQSPGIVTAAHLIELETNQLPPGERSYFGYGATIVAGEPHRPPFVHQGHVYIHLFNSNLAGYHWGQGVTYLVGKWWVWVEFVL